MEKITNKVGKHNNQSSPCKRKTMEKSVCFGESNEQPRLAGIKKLSVIDKLFSPAYKLT